MHIQKTNVLNSIGLLFRVFLFQLAVFSPIHSSDAAETRSSVMVYAEEGLWYSHFFTTDSEGWPDTLERKAYSTENEAMERARALSRETGARIESPVITRGTDPNELRTTDGGEIWVAEDEWSLEWEKRFADWTRKNLDRAFFSRYQIATDCADAAVALRWIFAREMKLPAGNRLVGNSSLLTNRSVRSSWKNLPTAPAWYDDRRFLAALDYVLVNTYTHSLHADAYPILIDPNFLTEGSFHLELHKSDGHTRVITSVLRDGSAYPIRDMWSNVPRKVRKLYEEPFVVFEQPEMRKGGMVRHRWVRLFENTATLVPAAEMPGYSLEQYQPDFFKHGVPDYSHEIVLRLREFFDPVLALDAIHKNVVDAIAYRKALVKDGYSVCSRQDCSPGSANYESWSTPSRDQRILDSFRQIQNYLATLTGDDLERFKKRYQSILGTKVARIEGKRRNFRDIEQIWLNSRYSSDPRDPPKRRWGL